jgi:hypothetical protein
MQPKMVWVLAVVCAQFVFSPVPGVADDQAPKETQNAISANVLGSLIAGITDSASGLVSVPLFFDYQKVLTDHYTLSIIPCFEFLVHSTIHNSISNSSLDSFDFQPWVELDWHPFDKGLNGFFVGLAGVGSLELKWSGNQDTTIFLGVAPVVGYLFPLPWNINLDFALGVAFGGNVVVSSSENVSLGLAAHSRIEIGLGCRF